MIVWAETYEKMQQINYLSSNIYGRLYRIRYFICWKSNDYSIITIDQYLIPSCAIIC